MSLTTANCGKQEDSEQTDNALVALAAAYRIFVLLLICTTFVPDEYFHTDKITCSTIRTWEWEPEHRIRSYLPLMPLIAGYKLLSLLGLDTPSNLELLPRLLFTLVAIVSDVYYMRLCKVLLPQPVTAVGDDNHVIERGLLSPHQCAFIVHTLSWSVSYMLPRTLGNSLETCLLVIGTSMLFAPCKGAHFCVTCKEGRRKGEFVSSVAVLLAAVSVYSRPTAVLLWVPIFLLKGSTLTDPLWPLIRKAIPISTTLLQAAILLDSYLYGQFTIAPLRFYTANVAEGYALHFGVKPWHWGFTEALPVMLGMYTPLVAIGARYCNTLRVTRALAAVSLFYTAGLAFFSPHMEIRFLLPALPFLHLLGGAALHQVMEYAWSNIPREPLFCGRQWSRRGLILAFAAQFVGVMYLVLYHQCGAEKTVALVGQEILHHASISAASATSIVVNIYIAAPCYTFPGYAGLHLPLSRSSYGYKVTMHTSPCYLNMRPAHYFDHSPLHHLTAMLYRTNTAHSSAGSDASGSVDYVLTFDSYMGTIGNLLAQDNFTQISEIPHAFFRYDLDDPHPKQKVLVFRRITMYELL